jgi:GWxTD domain-containing protein
MKKLLTALLLVLGISTTLFAQKGTTYRQLVMRAQAPTVFIQPIILPGQESGKATLTFTFRFNYNFIPFKKIPLQHSWKLPDEAQFYSTIRLNTEIFEGKLKRKSEPSANSVARDVWTDTLYTSTFEQTQSDKKFAAGLLSVQLKPGSYNYLLQLAMMQEINERSTQRHDVRIPNLNSETEGEIILINEIKNENNDLNLELINMEDNVPFGKDFYALIRLPNYDASAEYEINVHKANISRRDTTAGASIYTSALVQKDIHPKSTVTLAADKLPGLLLKSGTYDFTYAIVKIPGSSFENAPYYLSLNKKGKSKPVARAFFQSYWPDMPASLYNLNISIEMLKFIIPESELKKINSGSDTEREQKFRAFWAEKDPTPKTVYNELMAEYYRRIDFAYKEFGSLEKPLGYESDMGKIYIKFGPPSNKQRSFPEKGKTIEKWTYPNRTFIFETSTGFGDFVLVGQQ